jgi:hypothetical protein
VTDTRTLSPKSFLVYYPAIVPQSEIRETAHLVTGHSGISASFPADPIMVFESLKPRESFDTKDPVDLKEFGPTTLAPLGSVVWARSGDKVR